MHRVVVVLGVGRVDGDERQRPPVLARRGEADGTRRLGFLERGGRKNMRDVVGRERDEAHRALGLHRAQQLDDPCAREPEAPLAQRLDGDEVAVLGFARERRRDDEFAGGGALFDRKRTAGAVLSPAENGEDPRLELVEDLDDPARVGGLFAHCVGVELDPHQHPRAEARRARVVALGARAPNENPRRRAISVPFCGACDEFAVAIALGDVGDDNCRQPALDLKRLAAARDRALVFQVLDQQFQIRPWPRP